MPDYLSDLLRTQHAHPDTSFVTLDMIVAAMVRLSTSCNRRRKIEGISADNAG